MRITFLGTAGFAVPSLTALSALGHDIVAVVCQPDRAQGRGLAVTPSPVKIAAVRLGLPILQPRRIREPGIVEELRALRPEVQVIVAYGQILPRAIIDVAPLGTVNVHGSLLPRWRGAAPIQWAVASGDPVTGVTTMLIDEGLDTGPILDSLETAIGEAERATALSARLPDMGATLLCRTLEAMRSGAIEPRAQDSTLATHARALDKQDGLIDWRMPARMIHCRIRGFDPWPGAFTFFRGKLVKVLRASVRAGARGAPATASSVDGDGILICCGEDTSLLVEEVQPESRRPMPAHSFALGARIVAGSAFLR
jgi:methionyl-tRNA formyltransferase